MTVGADCPPMALVGPFVTTALGLRVEVTAVLAAES